MRFHLGSNRGNNGDTSSDQWVRVAAENLVSTATVCVAPEAAEAGLEVFQHASKYGIGTYRNLKKALGKGTGLEVHHLVEQRLAKILGIKPGDMKSIVLTHAEHSVFTQAWRKAIPYGKGTANATKQSITEAARFIYKDHPAILKALGLR